MLERIDALRREHQHCWERGCNGDVRAYKLDDIEGRGKIYIYCIFEGRDSCSANDAKKKCICCFRRASSGEGKIREFAPISVREGKCFRRSWFYECVIN